MKVQYIGIVFLLSIAYIRPTGQKYAITPSWSKVLLLVNIVVGTLNVEPVLEPI